MSSFDRKKKDSSSESEPLLQRQQQTRTAVASWQPGITEHYDAAGAAASAGITQQQYGASGSNADYANPGMTAPSPYDANNAMATGPGYFIPPPGHYPIPPQQHQQSPIIFHSPNLPSQQVLGPGEGAGGMLPQPPFYYPFPPPEGGALPQYQYPVYPMQEQRQQPQMGPNNSIPLVNTTSHSPTASGGLPNLNDIFNAPGGKQSQPSGYGSLTTSPKIYNAPIHRLPPSGRTSQQQQQQSVSRTNSSNEIKRLSKGGSSTTKEHRRVHSDAPLRINRLHQRANTEEALPRNGGGHNRARTLSGGNPFTPRSRHRRGDSISSYHSIGGGSYNAGSMADSSLVSMRSNIAKSSMFAGVDEEGRPLLYYPYEAVRLVMIPDHEKQERKGRDDDTAEQEDHLPLTIGHLYVDEPGNMDDFYEDYHRISDELEQGMTPQWESLDTHPLRKNKKLECEGYLTQEDTKEALPPTNYVFAVSDDIYRRMFSEVADAQSMPCGLFFCGHHEDVDYPSVWIPTTLVIILFGTLLYLSFLTEGYPS
jgi:hypothetical protein